MEQIAARVPEGVADVIRAYSDENDCTKSEAIRDLLNRGVEYERLQTENERLQNEKQALIEHREEHTELVKYVESERELKRYEEKRQRKLDNANLLTRAKWKITGIPVKDQ